jgi:hypothetical protein
VRVNIENREYQFEEVKLVIQKKDIQNVFFHKNNKTLGQTFDHHRYSRLSKILKEKYRTRLQENLGDFLKSIKEAGDKNYLCFLNKYGDETFCQFSIDNYLEDKGIYCFVVDGTIKYVGRCSDSFKKRINQGYGKIHPKNCFIDGQATNCHVNSLINSKTDVKFGVYSMNDSSTQQIAELEKMMLTCNRFEWNIQRK